MKLLSWNIKGIGGNRNLGMIRHIIKKNKVMFMELVETK